MKDWRLAFVYRLLLALVCFASLAAAGEAAGAGSVSGPQPYARVRVSIPPAGGRAEIRESGSTASGTVQSFPGTVSGDAPDAAGIGPEPQVLAVLYGADITGDDVIRELLRRRGRDTLEWIIGRNILRHELSRLKLAVTEEEVDDRLEAHLDGFRKAYPDLAQPDDLTRSAAGMFVDEYRERAVWTELALRKIMRVALKPTTAQLRGYYAERRYDFVKPERVRISQVFVAPHPGSGKEGIADAGDWETARRQIEEAHTLLRMGEDFDKVARTYGSGGQLSRWVTRGELLRELEDAAFGIEPGSHTVPLRSSLGYHIIHVDEKEARDVPPFEEVREEVLTRYEEAQFVLRAGEFMARLRERAERTGGLVLLPDAEDFIEPPPIEDF